MFWVYYLGFRSGALFLVHHFRPGVMYLKCSNRSGFVSIDSLLGMVLFASILVLVLVICMKYMVLHSFGFCQLIVYKYR